MNKVQQMLAIMATWVMATWTAPSGGNGVVIDYLFERGNIEHGWSSARLYADTVSTAPKPAVLPAGQTQHAWFVVSTDANSVFGWRHGSQAMRLWFVVERDTGTWSQPVAYPPGANPYAVHDTIGPSNVLVVGAGLPDTLFTDGRRVARPVNGVLKFQHDIQDSSLMVWSVPGPMVHYEVAQRALAPTMCQIEWRPGQHWWCLRGGEQPCP